MTVDERLAQAKTARAGGAAMPSTAIADFSIAYADQNERDYAAFAETVNSGRLTARPACSGPACSRGPVACRHPGLRPWPGRGLPA